MRTKRTAIIVVLIITSMLFMSLSAVFAVATPENPYVTIVNPVSETVVYSDNLLVSVKLTAPATIRVSVTQEFVLANGERTSVSLTDHLAAEDNLIEAVPFGDSNNFINANNLSFYTKRVENVLPGVYRITVETLNAQGNVTHINYNLVEVRASDANPAISAPVEAANSGTTQFLRNILRALFGN